MSKTTKIILIVTGTILGLASLIVTYFIVAKPSLFDNASETSSEDMITDDREPIETEECIPCSQKDDVPDESEEITPIHVSGNIVWWDQAEGYTTLTENSEIFDSAVPFWYALERNGSIKKTSYAENETIIDYCKQNNILITPTVSNGQTQAVSTAIFANDSIRETAINNIISKIETFNYDGIQLDFEDMSKTEIDDFSEFVQLLSHELHSRDKVLITTVHPKISDEGAWAGSQAQDWEEIGEYSDLVLIMTYDYHWSTSEAGEIAPLSWMRNVLTYAVQKIDGEKILLGLNFYGYDWVGTKASALEYNDVISLQNTYEVTGQMTAEKEKYFTYESSGFTHKVYYPDSETVDERINLVKEYEIGGVGIWRLGQEDPEIYNLLKNY